MVRWAYGRGPGPPGFAAYRPTRPLPGYLQYIPLVYQLFSKSEERARGREKEEEGGGAKTVEEQKMT